MPRFKHGNDSKCHAGRDNAASPPTTPPPRRRRRTWTRLLAAAANPYEGEPDNLASLTLSLATCPPPAPHLFCNPDDLPTSSLTNCQTVSVGIVCECCGSSFRFEEGAAAQHPHRHRMVIGRPAGRSWPAGPARPCNQQPPAAGNRTRAVVGRRRPRCHTMTSEN